MQSIQSLVIAGALAGCLSSHAVASVLTVDTVEPSSDVIFSITGNDSFTRLTDPADGSDTGNVIGSGQSFDTPDTGDANTHWAVSRITFQKSTAESFDNNPRLKLWVFTWNPDGNGNNTSIWFNEGDGIADDDPVDGVTGMSTVFSDLNIALPTTTIADEAFIHIALDSPLLLDENKTYGFMLAFDDDDSIDEQFELAIPDNSSTYGGGHRLRGLPNGNFANTGQDQTFYLEGVAVPEPASVLLVIAGGALLSLDRFTRGNRRVR